MTYVLKFLGVMVSMGLLDMAWTCYFISIKESNAMAAGWWSSIVVALGAFVTVSYVGDPSLLCAAILGAFFGTAITVKMTKVKL
jgi:hypothetical protein